MEDFIGLDTKTATGLALPKKANSAIKWPWFIV